MSFQFYSVSVPTESRNTNLTNTDLNLGLNLEATPAMPPETDTTT